MTANWWLIGYVGVMACWFVFAGIFILRKRPPKSKPAERRRDARSIVAIAMQGTGYAVVWVMFRKPNTPLIGTKAAPVLTVGAMVLAVLSVWFILISVRTLGSQWALAARVVEGHKLIMTGPYASVRNPIYTGMLGMLVATGIAMSRWPGIVAGVAVYLIGTMWRIWLEERLLRAEFGEEFEAYRRRVPALVPRITGLAHKTQIQSE